MGFTKVSLSIHKFIFDRIDLVALPPDPLKMILCNYNWNIKFIGKEHLGDPAAGDKVPFANIYVIKKT